MRIRNTSSMAYIAVNNSTRFLLYQIYRILKTNIRKRNKTTTLLTANIRLVLSGVDEEIS